MYKFYIKTLEYFIEARNNHTPYKYMVFKDDLERYKNDLYFDEDVNSFKITKNDIFEYFKRNHKESLDNLNNLGYCFYYGIGAEMNKSKAEKLFIKAGKKGLSDAQYNLGTYYGFLRYYNDIKENKKMRKQMEFWLNKANEQGYIPAKFALGELYCFGYVSEKNKTEYINEYILPAAEQGYPEAQLYLGKFYIAQKDIQKKIEWYTKAAENENIEAQNYLANAYFYGDKVAKDYDKAFYWFTKATKSHFCGNFVDYGDSLYHLGLSYLYGLGVGINQEKAVKLFTLASKHKNSKADFCLSLCYENGLGVNQDYEKAFKSYLESANKGVAYSQTQLGSCYENGYGVVKDYKKAFEWYTKASNQGETMAQGHLGEFYEKGYYVTKNIVKAVELYTKASWYEDADRLRRLYNLPTDNRKHYI